jgi:hypothetical protein
MEEDYDDGDDMSKLFFCQVRYFVWAYELRLETDRDPRFYLNCTNHFLLRIVT